MTTITEPDILCTDLVRIFSAQGIEVQALQCFFDALLPVPSVVGFNFGL